MRVRVALIASAVTLAGVAAAPAEAASLLLVNGRGWGHGIGMSQYGAQGFAANGWDYRQILGHYYPGTLLEPTPQATVRVLLAERAWVTVEGERYRAAELEAPVRIRAAEEPVVALGKPYRGDVVLVSNGETLLVVNELPLEHYLYGVVPREMPPAWNTEALKAQAVAARSYALATRKAGQPYDMYSDQRSQVYGGIEAEDWRASAAIDATAGEILTFGGRVASTFFFSTSGGKTASIADEWRAEPVPYLVSRPDPYDSISPHHRWGPVSFSGNQLHKRLGMLVDDVRVRLNRSGRVAAVVAERGALVRELTGADVRTRLGLRSTWFSLSLLTLEAPPKVGVGEPLVLQGKLRGVGEAVLERRPVGGAWERIGAVSPAPDGRFEAHVTPDVTATYRLVAAGAQGAAVRVVVEGRPRTVPRQIPKWAWEVLAWQTTPGAERGERPAAAPRKLPAWYWQWKLWRLRG